MATPLACDNNDGLEAKFIVGNAETGEQTFLCPVDMAKFGLAMAISLLDPAEIIAEVQSVQAAVTHNGQEQAPPPRGRKRQKPKVGKPTQDAEPVAGDAETPPPADHGGDRGL
jgi:hypothetical protein